MSGVSSGASEVARAPKLLVELCDVAEGQPFRATGDTDRKPAVVSGARIDPLRGVVRIAIAAPRRVRSRRDAP